MKKHIMHIPGNYFCYIDSELTLWGAATEVAGILGYTEEEFSSYYKNSLYEIIDIELREKCKKQLEQQLLNGDDVELVFSASHKNGTKVWLLNRGRRFVDEDGKECLGGVLIDITERKSYMEQQMKTLEKYQIILSQTENIIFEWDYAEDAMFFSNTWETIFGYKPETANFSKVLGAGNHFYEGDNQRLMEHVHVIFEGKAYQICEVRIRKADGEYLWCRVRATGVYDEMGVLKKIVGIIIDIDNEKRAACELQERAERDSLTKLYNAHTTRKKTEEYLCEIDTDIKCALLIIDLDNFKHVNDTFGHMFGDVVLTQAAQIIRNMFRSQDIVGRIGGDEFMVLMKNVSDKELVDQRCIQLLHSFRNIFSEHMYGKGISCSIGVALSPVDGKGYFDLFRCADQALYHAKDLGKNQYAFFDGSNISDSDGRADEYSTSFFSKTDCV